MANLMSLFTFFALIYIAILPADAKYRQQQSPGLEKLTSFSTITDENGVKIKRTISQQLPMKADADNRIIAGDPNYDFDLASAKEFPWMVSIEAKFVKYYQCGPSSSHTSSFNMISNGVLINDQWILTSASGLYWNGNATITSPCDDPDYEETYLNPLANEAIVTLGALNMSYSGLIPSEPQRVVIKSRLILPHPDFKFEELEGQLPADLALIQLPNPIEFNEFISPITLPSGVSSSLDNLTMVSYAYLIRRPGTYPGENARGRGDLRKAEVMDEPVEECRSTFPNGQLNESYVECVSGLGFAYSGDQGAAIAYADNTNWTLNAIASKLNYYARSNWAANSTEFSVGVKIEPHRGWIDSVVNDGSITQPPVYPATPLYPVTDGAGRLRSLTITIPFLILCGTIF